MTYTLAYLSAGIAFLLVDAVWLTFAANRLYRPLLGDMLLPGFNLAPAVAFYLIYIFGIVYFAVRPALLADSWQTAAVSGALLGFVAYATYDLTNQATLKDWPLAITLADLCWGTFLTAAAATLAYLVTQRLAPLT